MLYWMYFVVTGTSFAYVWILSGHPSFMHLNKKLSYRRDSARCGWNGNSRSLKVIRCCANRRDTYDFLLALNSNLTCYLQPFLRYHALCTSIPHLCSRWNWRKTAGSRWTCFGVTVSRTLCVFWTRNQLPLNQLEWLIIARIPTSTSTTEAPNGECRWKINLFHRCSPDGATVCCSCRIVPVVLIQYIVTEIQNGCHSAIMRRINSQL